VRVLREIYDFVTGGSIVAPVGLACAVIAAMLVPQAREAVFLSVLAATFVASTFERPT
jgi:hypothetical protein